MTLLGTFKVSIPTATFATLGVILSAGYALWLYRKVVFGALVKPSLSSIKDLTFRECLTLFPLIALTILFGVYPKPVLDMASRCCSCTRRISPARSSKSNRPDS